MRQAILALEDGSVFEGSAFGAPCLRTGEVVFNTSINRYHDIITHPTYAGHIVILTYPHIGNYGTTPEDDESVRPFIEGLVVREFSSIVSNWRSKEHANDFLGKYNIPAISDIDTRRLVRHLRTRGVMRGALSSIGGDPRDLVERARSSPSMAGLDLATRVSVREPYTWTSGVEPCSPSELVGPAAVPSYHVVAFDYGIKRNILRRLVQAGCRVTVVPATTTAEDVLSLKPDGVFLSNGPGDPEPLAFQAAQVRALLGRTPVFGICLGHQVLGLASGGRTYKLKFGHRGGNHPVLNKITNKVEITSHNHGFAVDPDSLPDSTVELTHVNLNDQTLEGFRRRDVPAFCVQYHPEAAPGPHDSQYLFDDFIRLMAGFREGR